MFRKCCQAFGISLVLIGLYQSFNLISAIISNDLPVLLGLVRITLVLFVTCGLGLLFVVFDPHKVIQYFGNFHRLVKPPTRRKSFADRIGAGEDDDQSQ
jgi:hypothetical protein